MKIRNGFVSNSSSTSFSIFGVYLKDSEALMNNLLGDRKSTRTPNCEHEFDREKAKFCPECGKPAGNICMEKRDAETVLKGYFNKEKIKLDVIRWGGCGEICRGGIYIGKDLRNKDFNASPQRLDILKEVESLLKKWFKTEDISFYSDGGYEG